MNACIFVKKKKIVTFTGCTFNIVSTDLANISAHMVTVVFVFATSVKQI